MLSEHPVNRLRKVDGLIRSEGRSFRHVRRNRRHNKYFTRFGTKVAGSRTPYATNGKSINQLGPSQNTKS